MTIGNLENKLQELDESTRAQLLAGIRNGRINPQEDWREMPYLKDDLAAAIYREIEMKGLSPATKFRDNLYSGEIRKEPLKKVYYGLKSSEKVPKQVLSYVKETFSDLGELAGEYALTYFFAGVWENPALSGKETIPEAVSTLINAGIENLYKNYYVRKAKGEYKSEIKLPYTSQIKERLDQITSLKPMPLEKAIETALALNKKEVKEKQEQPSLF